MPRAYPAGEGFRVSAMLRRLATCLALLCVAGCVSESGPVAVEQVNGKITPFPGLANLLRDLPEGGSLNVFVADGMATFQDESNPPLRGSIAQRLNLNPVYATQQLNLASMSARPDIRLDGASIWPPDYTGWQCSGGSDPANALNMCDAPYLDVSRYQTADGKKQVVFYSLNYWASRSGSNAVSWSARTRD
jgi:hypothetical protein